MIDNLYMCLNVGSEVTSIQPGDVFKIFDGEVVYTCRKLNLELK